MIFDPISKEFLMTAEKTRMNIFLTGNAWTWKSTLVDYFVSKTSKKFVLLWTTGTAAINISWQTLHIFFWIWKNWSTRKLDREKIEYIKSIDGFIIDETSMLRADLFDILDQLLRSITWVDKVFWWKQIIFVWDLLQLPPVLVRHRKVDGRKVETEEYRDFVSMYAGRFFFFAKWYDKRFFKTVNLQKVHRQDNQELINNLNLIRAGIQSNKILSIFNNRLTTPDKLNPKAIYIASSNATVDKINKERLGKNPNKDILLSAIIRGDFDEEDYPASRRINVKKDCRIMFTKNHPDQLYSNWTLATLKEINKNDLLILMDDGSEYKLQKQSWQNITWVDEFWDDIIAWTFTQYPIKVAHAITIHKSQGKTFDNVVIDTGYWCFESGMLYVALSRVTSLEWLQIVKMLKLSDIQSDIDVKKFLDS